MLSHWSIPPPVSAADFDGALFDANDLPIKSDVSNRRKAMLKLVLGLGIEM
ncbi:hypothetical protein OCU04_006906 [Sclerotinia nivalis]|uniref:Uncharacterized protein n=1 Tax=Sclerotinia nivalis TaxID=352851 RepID=A0A9X0DL08_9HELO|nr:hypothetical protein OCU04_006906 [Sclerotinia nivalis]